MEESVQRTTKYEDGGAAHHQMKMTGSLYQKFMPNFMFSTFTISWFHRNL
jgi:hypothetical protein